MEGHMAPTELNGPTYRLTFDDAVEIWILVWDGVYKHRIAAHYNVNVARIYDVLNERLHPGSRVTAEKIRAERKDVA
jgi:hypothetical protein